MISGNWPVLWENNAPLSKQTFFSFFFFYHPAKSPWGQPSAPSGEYEHCKISSYIVCEATPLVGFMYFEYTAAFDAFMAVDRTMSIALGVGWDRSENPFPCHTLMQSRWSLRVAIFTELESDHQSVNTVEKNTMLKCTCWRMAPIRVKKSLGTE